MSIKLPRLYVNGAFKRIVYPITVSINQNIVPLDTASMTLPYDENLPARSWVELFTPYGSAGMFRVRSPHDAYGQDTTTVELEHMISEVGDYRVKEEISEMLPANTAMQRVFKHYSGGKWKLGSVSALGSGKIACEANYDRVLDTMLAILEQKKDVMMSFDFTTKPWTVNFVKKGTTVAAEGRLARNVTSATISCDDTELYTRVWYQTFDKNHNGTWKYKDASTKSKYGIIEGTVRTSADMTDEELNATVNAFIEDHKDPRYSISIQGVELSQITGESLDKMTVGKLYRLNIPEKSVRQEMNITSIFFTDVYNAPRQMTINLGAEQDTVVTFLHNLDAKGRGGGGGGRAKDKEEEFEEKYISDWQKRDDYIGGWVEKVDKAGTILEKAGLDINSNGVLIYATGKDTIGSRFEVTKNAINLKADKITLNGYVKAKDLTAQFFKSKITQLDIVSVGTLTATNRLIAYGDIRSSEDVVIGATSLRNAIISATVSGNVLTLKNVNGDTTTFSKATTLTGVWSAGNYKVTASPQGVELNSGGLTSLGGQARRDGDLLYVPINAGTESTGYEAFVNWKNLLTSHSNCVAGLNVFNSGSKVTLYYKYGETDYRSAGNYYWYYKSSYSGTTTYYN